MRYGALATAPLVLSMDDFIDLSQARVYGRYKEYERLSAIYQRMIADTLEQFSEMTDDSDRSTEKVNWSKEGF